MPITQTAGGIAFVGKPAVALYQAIALKHGIRLYANTGMKPNRAWTPTRMLALASQITGQKFGRGRYEAAAQALEAWIHANRPNA